MPMLEVHQIHKSFGDREVLKGVDLSVEKGEVVAILGPSGSGKTTLLRCINFLEKAGSGTLVFDGESFDLAHISHKDIARLRRKTAFVFQSYNLFRNKTVLQNVTEGLIVARRMPKAQAEEIAVQMLEKVGMADRCSQYPHQLSGGQQQRVAIARALATNPEIIYFDEPHLGPGPRAHRRGAGGHAPAGRRGDDHAGGDPRDGLCPGCVQPGDFHGGRPSCRERPPPPSSLQTPSRSAPAPS